ncbi:MAG: hypothetical protein ACYCTE_15155, partial [Acidimicrobiales bacterium]
MTRTQASWSEERSISGPAPAPAPSTGTGTGAPVPRPPARTGRSTRVGAAVGAALLLGGAVVGTVTDGLHATRLPVTRLHRSAGAGKRARATL